METERASWRPPGVDTMIPAAPGAGGAAASPPPPPPPVAPRPPHVEVREALWKRWRYLVTDRSQVRYSHVFDGRSPGDVSKWANLAPAGSRKPIFDEV